MTVPTLILVGERDQWARAGDCRELLRRNSATDSSAVEGDTPPPLSLVVYPGAHHAFDNPAFRAGRRFLWHWVEYDAAVADRAVEDVRTFLRATLGG
jgi:dienelactone hydrolase